MKILPLFMLFACVAWQALAQEEGESRSAASRGLLKRGLAPRGKPTTTTTPAPQDDAEYDEEGDYPAEGESPEPSTEAPPASSTEGKKLVGSGVRPFRSNTDLLETLKRRRAQAAEAKARGPGSAEAAQDAPAESAKSSFSGKKRFNNAPAKEATTNEEAPAPPSAKPSRGRFGRPSARSLDPEAEEQNDAAPPARNSRFSRQRGSSV